jgi:hypothetical protein
MSSFREECAPYFAKGPIMLHKPEDAQIDGNGLLYTGLYATIAKELNCFRAQEDNQLVVAAYNLAVVKPGLIDRGRDNLSPEEHDDYIGLAAAQWHVGQAMLTYGKNNNYIYNNMNLPGIKNSLRFFFARIPGFVCHLKLSANEAPSPFDRLYWCVGILASAFFGGTDASGYQLKWLMVKRYDSSQSRNKVMDIVSNIWKAKIISKYPNAMGGVFADYFGPQHPFAVHMKGRI